MTMTAKPPFIQLNLDDTKKQRSNKARLVRKAFTNGHECYIRVYVPNRKDQAAGEAELLTFCARTGALPMGKWNWTGRVLDLLILKGTS